MNSMPADWRTVKIADVTVHAKQRDPSKAPDTPFRYVDVSSVSNALFKITSATEMLGKNAPSRARKEIRANDILFATVRPTLKRIALVPQELDGEIASTGYCILRPNLDVVVPEYLYQQLLTDSFIKKMGSLERGASYPAVRDSDVLSAAIPLPSLDEQRRIARVLSTVQAAIEQQEQLIAVTRELKSALMHKLFTEGLNGERQQETEIGLVPKSWEQLRLERTGDVIYGIQAAVANNMQPIGMKILTNKNITLDGQIVLDEINYFELKTKRHFETILRKGDILFNWRSGSKEHIGKTAYFNLDGEYTHSSFILRIRPNENVNGRFLFWYLYFLRASGYFLQKHDISSVNATFNKSAVDALSVFLPSRDDQEVIASALDTVDSKIALLKQKRDVQEELFRTLLHQLMTAEIRVNEVDLSNVA
jgi:type I restriction enzyme, S subunit